MNRAVSKITVSPGQDAYIRAGDVLRMPSTGEVLKVTAARGGGPRHWRPLPLHVSIWRWLRRQGWQRIEVTERWRSIIRVYRMRPSPLPRRLP